MTGFRWILAVALLGFACQGCAILSLGQGGHEHGSADLSGAAQAASDSSYGRPNLNVGHTTPPEESTVESETSEPAPSLAAGEQGEGDGAVPLTTPRPPRHDYYQAGFLLQGGSLGGQDYDGFSGFGLSFGTRQDRARVDANITASNVLFKGESLLGRAMKDAGELRLDVMARYYLTPSHTFMGLYPVFGLGTGTLFWTYARPVEVIENGAARMVEDDRINHFSFCTGLGMSLLQTRHLHVGGNLVGGVRFYGRHTDAGLKNDLLPTTGYAQLLVDINYHWTRTY